MPETLHISLEENLRRLQQDFEDCADYMCRRFALGQHPAALLGVDGLVGKQLVSISILNPLLREFIPDGTGEETMAFVCRHTLGAVEQLPVTELPELIDKLMAGFAVLLVDGFAEATVFGVQGFSVRSLSEPENETMLHGAKDGFVEAMQVNMMLIRRRLHTTKLKFVPAMVGTEGRVPVLIAYVQGKADPAVVQQVKDSLSACTLQNIFAAEYLTPYLVGNGIFNKIGATERPDTACGKLSEGRVAVIVDGCTSVLVLPQLFIENFQTPDDYANRPMYAAFNRLCKMAAFVLSVFLPGGYVAVCGFHPELLPEDLLVKIATASSGTPFSLFVESILSFFLYELMREAGLRAPKSLSHAVSIVGALVIGDMAVSSGLLSQTTLIVTAITAIAGYVTPKLYQASTLLRLVFIFIGGILGLWGIALGALAVLFNTCSEVSFGVPITWPLAPFFPHGWRDVFIRRSWRSLSPQEPVPAGKGGRHGEP